MRKLGRSRRPPLSSIILREIVSALFPRCEPMRVPVFRINMDEIPEVSHEELKHAVTRIKVGKAPGLDGIPNFVIRHVIKIKPELFRQAYTSCLREGIFPQDWKRQRLVLLPKGGKPKGRTLIISPSLHAQYGRKGSGNHNT